MKVIFVEQDRCLACRSCEQVCSFQDSGGFRRENASIWVRIDLDFRQIFTITCLQCDLAYCMEACPTGAIQRDPGTRAVVVDEALCVGCRMCVNACPFGCMHFDAKRRIAAKCNLCNGDPKCVQSCMAEALHFGDINELAAIKRKKVDRAFARARLPHTREPLR